MNWNGKTFLSPCLQAIQAQTFKDFEVIVVDNGSVDGSVELLRNDFPEVSMVSLPENRGYCGGNNAGLEVATGQYVVLLNNDTVPDGNWLEELVACMHRHPDAGFCVPKCLEMDNPHLIDSAGAALTIAGWFYETGQGDMDGVKFDEERQLCVGGGVSLMLRRESLQRVGRLDEDYFTSCEDVDLTLRIRLAGYEGYYAPKSVLYHKRRGTGGRRPAWLAHQFQRNMELVWIKNLPLLLLIIGLPFRAIFWGGSLLRAAVGGQVRAYVAAKVAALRMAPAFWRKRRETMRLKKLSDLELLRSLEGGWLTRGRHRFVQLVRDQR